MDFSLSIPTPKTQKVENKDIFSRLPDELVSHIVSLLPPKDAQRTGILSNRWKYIWVFLPSLVFKIRKFWTSTEMGQYMNFVEKIMIIRDGMPIQSFIFCCWRHCHHTRVRALISTVLKCNVQELFLGFHGIPPPGKAGIPWENFMFCNTLVVLTLSGRFKILVPENVLFPSLKTLNLKCIEYMGDKSVVNLFSGCPVLEILSVERILTWIPDNIKTFKISIPSLRKLYISFIRDLTFTSSGYKLVLDAPNLEYLELVDLLSQEYSFKRLPSLVDAHICAQQPSRLGTAAHGDSVASLLKSIIDVTILSMAQPTLEAISCASNLNIPTFNNLVQLCLGLDLVKGWWFLPSFLECMPNLEDLCFSDGLVPSNRSLRESFKFNWHPPANVPNCLQSKIRIIEIDNPKALSHVELDLIAYLLKNAYVLESMMINRHDIDPMIQKKLLDFERGSTYCDIELTEVFHANSSSGSPQV